MSAAELLSQGSILFITLFAMMVGLLFTVIPPLPGTVVVWAAATFYGLVLGWEKLGWLSFGLLTFLMIVGLGVDFMAGHFGARMGGASCLALIVGAVLGLIVGIVASLIGTPILGCFAGLVGMVGGLLWVEWKRNGDWPRAVRATKGYVAGAAAGVMAKVTSGVLMLAVFLVTVYVS